MHSGQRRVKRRCVPDACHLFRGSKVFVPSFSTLSRNRH
jgi:hypothetical protein